MSVVYQQFFDTTSLSNTTSASGVAQCQSIRAPGKQQNQIRGVFSSSGLILHGSSNAGAWTSDCVFLALSSQLLMSQQGNSNPLYCILLPQMRPLARHNTRPATT
eukprot:4860679-Amphidinium_carterae.1